MRLLLPSLLVAFLPNLALALPPLEQTELYVQRVSACHDVDLTVWEHPIRNVLQANGIKLQRVELCNGERYPIFHVELPYDPQGQSQRYFQPLYQQMKKANGKWPYAFVATSDNTVVSVAYRPDGSPDVSYQMYEAPLDER